MIQFKGNLPPQTTDDEEKEIFQNWNVKSRQRLIEGNMRLALHIAKQFDGQIDSDELVAIAMLGLVKSADSFKPELGFKFSSFSATCIQNEILNALRRDKKSYLDISLETVLACGDDSELKTEDIIYDLSPEECFKKIEDKETIKNILLNAKLPNKEKTILEQWVKGRKQKEIAKDLGYTQANVSKILKRIFKKLRVGEI